jgi:ethanolamine utilization protein EutA
MHCRESEGLESPIVSIDGIDLAEFDFIDIGAVIAETGAVPVVVKSLIFPEQQSSGQDHSFQGETP